MEGGLIYSVAAGAIKLTYYSSKAKSDEKERGSRSGTLLKLSYPMVPHRFAFRSCIHDLLVSSFLCQIQLSCRLIHPARRRPAPRIITQLAQRVYPKVVLKEGPPFRKRPGKASAVRGAHDVKAYNPWNVGYSALNFTLYHHLPFKSRSIPSAGRQGVRMF